MTVAIVHYHLGPGGVSQVIATASRSLTTIGFPHVILVGAPPDDSVSDLPVRVVPGLGYPLDTVDFAVEQLVSRTRAAAVDALGCAPDVWHFHNHSLGKNPLMHEVVARLARENERLVLHIHDLAEDGRPANHRMIAGCAELYPFSPRILYAFLNERDMAVFLKAGLPVENAGVLANPIAPQASVAPPSGIGQPDPQSSPILFAPVRGIRRKNPGELLFLSALAPQGVRIAISRAPLDADALAIHNTWQKFAVAQRLPVGFDVAGRYSPVPGASGSFESWLAHASHIVTTSVAEGFGLPFLEAIARRKPLIGRNLPHIAAEHARHGIRAGNLYEQLLIPAEWVDLSILRENLTTTLERNHRAYGRRLYNDVIEETFDALVHDGWLDFGNLPEPLQQGAIERLAEPAYRKIPLVKIGDATWPAQDWLAAAISNRTPSCSPEALAPYSPDQHRNVLISLYSHLWRQPVSPLRFVPPAGILTNLLTPRSFHFLLSAAKPKSVLSRPYRAVICDVYGTLLIAAAGGVKPDPDADPLLRATIASFGHTPPESPSAEIHAAVLRHHAAVAAPFPEIDLRVLWREVLGLDEGTETTALVEAIEAAWHPAKPMPGAANAIRLLARSGISLGILSNAQCNTLGSLGGIADLFAPELTVLSYQHGVAKPSPELFAILTDRLAGRGIRPGEALFIGNDPLQDIVPAAAHGFRTALFKGHPESVRPGDCSPDHVIDCWSKLPFLRQAQDVEG